MLLGGKLWLHVQHQLMDTGQQVVETHAQRAEGEAIDLIHTLLLTHPLTHLRAVEADLPMDLLIRRREAVGVVEVALDRDGHVLPQQLSIPQLK